MKLIALVLFALVLAPLTASAAPIALGGVWSPVSIANNDGDPYFDRESWDGEWLNVAYLLAHLPDLEYLHNGSGQPVAFTLPGVTRITPIAAITAWAGFLSYAPDTGILTYTVLTEPHVWRSDLHPQQFVLLRSRGDASRYWLGVEDIPFARDPSDHDFNDHVSVIAVETIPEPGTLILFGVGLTAMARRWKMSAKGVYREH